MTFDSFFLHDNLLAELARMEHSKPTTIQQHVLPPAMEQKDILACAPTGTGKTAAFLLPTLQHLLDSPRKASGFARAIILTPTRELASQIHQYASHLAYSSDLKVAIITPDADIVDNPKVNDPAYIVFQNYELVLKWNRSLRFGLAVCTLKDKLHNEL